MKISTEIGMAANFIGEKKAVEEVAKAGKNSAVEIVLSASVDVLPPFLSSFDSEKVQ